MQYAVCAVFTDFLFVSLPVARQTPDKEKRDMTKQGRLRQNLDGKVRLVSFFFQERGHRSKLSMIFPSVFDVKALFRHCKDLCVFV